MSSRKTVLVTGCSAGGVGAGLALALARQGHRVFATARNLSKIPSELTDLSAVSTLQLDVTSADSVAAAAKAVGDATEEQGARGLDVLVNNAGLGYTMPVLDIDIDKAQMLFETNFWGPLRAIQAFSDLLIAKEGRVVNVSSVAAVLNTPWISTYASSKAALTALSDTLRLELHPFNVSVVTVMLGTVDTPFRDNEPRPVLPPTSRYTAILDTITHWSKGKMDPQGGSVEELARSLLPDILDQGRNGQVWRGTLSTVVKLVSRWLPAFVVDRLILKYQGIDDLSKSLKE